MTSGDENGDAASPEADNPSDASTPPPPVLTADEWRTFFASLPPRELWRVLLKEPISHARIFAGFRPSAPMLRTHPIVVKRLVEEAVKHPAFAKSVREIVPPAPPEAAPFEEPAPAADAPANPESSPANDESLLHERESLAVAKEKLKEVRGVMRTQVARIKALEAALVQAERDREAAHTEAAHHLAARRVAETEARRAEADAERQKRDHDRAARRAESAAKEPVPQPPPLAADIPPPAFLPPPVTVPDRLLHDAAQRLIQENRFAQVIDLCREALRLINEGAATSSDERGRVHALYASALYGASDKPNAGLQDGLAAVAFLDGGDCLAAAEAIVRRLARGTDGVRAADVPILRRLTLLAQKMHQMDGVRAVFFRLRITAPSAFRRLQEASGVMPSRTGAKPVSGGAVFADLLGGSAGGGNAVIGPDEAVSLPLSPSGGGTLGSVTPRLLVRAVDGGNADYVQNVRAALAALRDQNKQSAKLADALLEAVAELSPVAVCPFLQATRPVFVDASNVARYNPDPLALEAPPRLQNLRMLREFLLRSGSFPVTMIADANLRFHMDDKAAYLEMVEKQIVREAPPGITADEVLIREAYESRAQLITNDRLAEWGESARRIARVGFLFTASGVSLTPF